MNLDELRRELAGMTLREFRRWLTIRGVETIYGMDELQQDIDSLRDLGRLS